MCLSLKTTIVKPDHNTLLLAVPLGISLNENIGLVPSDPPPDVIGSSGCHDMCSTDTNIGDLGGDITGHAGTR